jgi:aromatic amino acid aminotransferase I
MAACFALTRQCSLPSIRAFLMVIVLLIACSTILRFSKVLAPGMRLGWVTSNALFHQKLSDYTDSSTQPPHAFGQMFVTEMLGEHGWKMDGFCRWLKSLRLDYQQRRNFLLDVFRREVEPTGYASVNCPEAGMFVWIKVFFERHPRFTVKHDSDGSPVVARTNTEFLLKELFERLMNTQGVVFIPSSTFAIPENPTWVTNDGHVPLRDVSYCQSHEHQYFV